jgi:hypothetical protein
VAEPDQKEPVPGGLARLSHQAQEPVGLLTPPVWSRWFGRALSVVICLLVGYLAIRASPWG